MLPPTITHRLTLPGDCRQPLRASSDPSRERRFTDERGRSQGLITLSFVIAFLLSVLASAVFAQDFESTIEELEPVDMEGNVFRVSALLFGDLFTIPHHHLEDFDDESGWWTRRIYVTGDFANFHLGKTVARLRLEVNQLDDFSTDYKSTIKDAYLQFRAHRHRVWAGRIPTLTFSSVEEHWGYRWFEKTPMDIQGAPSRFDGVRASGPLSSGDAFYYRVGVGQSKDLGFETDKVKKGQFAFTYITSSRRFFADAYLDYLEEDQDINEDKAWSFQLFGGWNGEVNYAGLLYFQRQWDNLSAERLRVLSGYFVHAFRGRHWEFVGRIDRLLDPSIKGDGIDYIPFDPTAEATAMFAGFGLKVHKNIDIMPNVKYVYYDENDEGTRPDADLYLNFTINVKVP